jgi:hypothetical protein
LWRDRAKRLLTIWRLPSFDPYASWTIFDAGEFWVRRVVAQQRYVAASTVDVDTYVADIIINADAARHLLESIKDLGERASPPRENGVVLDGMRLGIRTESVDAWWHGHLDTPYNTCWDATRRQLDAGMPACTIPIQARHQWVDYVAE